MIQRKVRGSDSSTLTAPVSGLVWLAASLALSACASTGGGKTVEPAAGTVANPPQETDAWDACYQPAKLNEILSETASRRLLQTVCGATLWFDGLFGQRDLNAAQSSYGHIEVSTAYSQFRGVDNRVRFDARVKLQALKGRLSAFVGLDNQDDFARDRAEGYALRSRTEVSDRDAFLAGLGFAVLTTDRFQSDFKVGVRDPRLPKIFAQNRFSWIPYSNSQGRVLVRLTPFWNNRDGFGTTTSTDVDRVIGDVFLLRWGNTGTITEKSDGFDWRSAVVLYQNLLGSSALAYETFVRGATAAAEPLGEYGVRGVYRWPFLLKSLFGQLVLGYSWPRDDPALPREGSADIGLGVEMPFGIAPK